MGKVLSRITPLVHCLVRLVAAIQEVGQTVFHMNLHMRNESSDGNAGDLLNAKRVLCHLLCYVVPTLTVSSNVKL